MDVNLGHHPVVAVVASLVEDLVGCGWVLQVHVQAAGAFTNNETLHSTRVQQYSTHTSASTIYNPCKIKFESEFFSIMAQDIDKNPSYIQLRLTHTHTLTNKNPQKRDLAAFCQESQQSQCSPTKSLSQRIQ